MVNDKEIIQAMQQNAEKGFRLLMISYKEPVYWHIRRLVVSHDDAQDAAQETFVRIFRNFSQYNEVNSYTDHRLDWLFSWRRGSSTGINATTSINPSSASIYDLCGRKVSTLTKGIYLIDGKKVIVK